MLSLSFTFCRSISTLIKRSTFLGIILLSLTYIYYTHCTRPTWIISSQSTVLPLLSLYLPLSTLSSWHVPFPFVVVFQQRVYRAGPLLHHPPPLALPPGYNDEHPPFLAIGIRTLTFESSIPGLRLQRTRPLDYPISIRTWLFPPHQVDLVS